MNTLTRTALIFCLAFGLTAFWPNSATAQTYFFDWDANGGNGGDYNTGTNWNNDSGLSDQVPQNDLPVGDGTNNNNAFIATNNDASNPVNINGATPNIRKLYLGETSGGTAGTGVLNMNSGSFTVEANVDIGAVAGGFGQMDIEAGATFTHGAAQNFRVGIDGTGIFNP